ncbi:MAG: 3'-5' exonuclease, partial [Thiothrix litoralis]
DSDEDHIPLLTPQSAGRHGLEPELRHFDSFSKETRTIAHWLQHWHDNRNMAWSDMCIVYRHTPQGRQLHEALQTAAIPCQWLDSSKTKKQFNPHDDSVKLMTMHSSKGLEFPLVVVAGLGFMPEEGQDVQAEAKLLYVAMTRSTEKLLLTYHQETVFTRLMQGHQTELVTH